MQCSEYNNYIIFSNTAVSILQHVVSQFGWYRVTVPCTVLLYLQIVTCGFSTLYIPLQFFKYLYILLQNWRSYSVSMRSQPSGIINHETGSGFGCKCPNLQHYKSTIKPPNCWIESQSSTREMSFQTFACLQSSLFVSWDPIHHLNMPSVCQRGCCQTNGYQKTTRQ